MHLARNIKDLMYKKVMHVVAFSKWCLYFTLFLQNDFRITTLILEILHFVISAKGEMESY